MKEITIPQNQDIVKLLGINDVNLKYLRKAFPSIELNVRGNSIFLEGDEKLISDFQKIFDEMVIMNKKNENIEISDIELLTKLKTLKNQKNESFNQLEVTNNKQIKIKNLTQFKYLEAIEKSTITFGIGPAGTGKTFLAVASAVKMYSEEKIKKIVLTRPAVEAGERLGYLPGDLSQKIDPYLVPLFDSLEYFLGNESLQYLIEKRNIEIVPLAYMRGRTLNNACIILDEAQNSTLSQIKMFLTRLGEGSKMIITGDESQVDLNNTQLSGLKKVRKTLTALDEIEVVEFMLTDIVRNKIVSKILEVFPKNNE
jgi:phosphate starvation-inducible PhoH-like protein